MDTVDRVNVRRTRTRTLAPLALAALLLAACNQGGAGDEARVPIPGAPADSGVAPPPGSQPSVTAGSPATTSAGATTTTVTTASPADSAAPDSATPTDSTEPSAPAAPATTAPEAATGTTSTTVPALDVFAPECVVEVQAGDSLGAISDRYDDETITVATVRAENAIEGETIYPGQLLDICVDNGLDDVTGSEREANSAIVASTAIGAQQTKLNELFAGLGVRDLLVDGVSGPVTRQRLCAARLGLSLPVTLTDMAPGSPEEQTLMASTALTVPFTTAALSERWILIDRTCQIMFVGQGATQINFVFPTSTGEAGYQTRDQDRSRAFRFDPALENGGWHDSTDYPVPIDNPLNGNMYKPLYFDGGQAIHGANNVPTTPQSKGCARLRPADHDLLLSWLGLADAQGPTNDAGRINVTVNVQGEYPAPPPEPAAPAPAPAPAPASSVPA